MKKKLFGILLALSMILCLFPIVALAEEDENQNPNPGQPIFLEVTQIAATITEPKLGQTPDYQPTLTADQENGVELDYVDWYKIAAADFTGTWDDNWEYVEEGEVFEPGYYYSSEIFIDPVEGFVISQSITGTINGFPHNNTDGDIYQANEDEQGNKDTWAYLACVFDPLYEITTYEIPFTKVVKQGGNVAPGQETFTLELFDIGAGEEADFPDVSYTATVTTNGAGQQTGKIVFTGPENQLFNFLIEGFMVREQKGSAEGWTYSDAVWGVQVILGEDFEWPKLNFERVIFYPAIYEESDNGGYYIWDESAIADAMTFENTYTANQEAVEPTETPKEVPTEAPTEAPKPAKKAATVKTDDPNNPSNIALWLSVLFVSGAGLVKIISKKKELTEKY